MILLLVCWLPAATACGGSAEISTAASAMQSTIPATTAPPTTVASSSTAATFPHASVELLAAFPTAEVEVGSETWRVAVAGTPELRARGLMGVTDLGDLDGMLFVWQSDSTSSFWMKDTPMPLDVAFFTAEGSLVEVLEMAVCETDPCPTYRPSDTYRYALEAPAGRLAGSDEAVLVVPPMVRP